MRPSAAETARTLARGRLPGLVRFDDGLLGGLPVAGLQHATDGLGRPLLLAPAGEELATRLARTEGPVRLSLSVDDVPPRLGAPSLGRVRIVGDLHPVPPAETREAVLEYAVSSADPDLFDVGDRVAIHRLEPSRITLNRGGATEILDPAAYAAAEPDPLHECEQDLLHDLADHHLAQLEDYLRRLLDDPGAFANGSPQAMRLDRYGIVLDLSPAAGSGERRRWMRLEFARPVAGQHDLAHLLHPILCAHRRCDAEEE
ncbi:DUF2470 domain-containing protein [Glycomyces sp. NPDC047010]|uniref:DUF2470 domain-containing protein n=1 Tax=Glycomyces sp. NPDC047010 TaxID=3155023 RepID=UPI0033F6DE9B